MLSYEIDFMLFAKLILFMEITTLIVLEFDIIRRHRRYGMTTEHYTPDIT